MKREKKFMAISMEIIISWKLLIEQMNIQPFYSITIVLFIIYYWISCAFSHCYNIAFLFVLAPFFPFRLSRSLFFMLTLVTHLHLTTFWFCFICAFTRLEYYMPCIAHTHTFAPNIKRCIWCLYVHICVCVLEFFASVAYTHTFMAQATRLMQFLMTQNVAQLFVSKFVE